MQHAQIPEAHVMKRLIKRQRADATSARPRAAAATTRRRASTAGLETTRSRPAAANTPAAATSARGVDHILGNSQRSAAAVVTTRSVAASKPDGTSLASTSTASNDAASAITTAAAKTSTVSHVGLIVGVAVAGIAVLAIIFGLIFFCRRRRNNRNKGAGTSTFSNGNNHGFKKHVNDDNELFGNSAESAEKNDFVGAFGAPKSNSKQHDDGRGSWDAPSYSSHGNSNANNLNPSGNGYNAHHQQQQPTNMGNQAPSTMNLLDDHKRIEQREMQQHLEMQQKQQEHAFAVSPQVAAAKPSANPFGGEQQGQGAIHMVKRTFEPTLSDELVLLPGDRVQLLVRYDDGWALGINLDAKTPPGKGVFPFDCLDETTSASVPPQAAPQQLHTIVETSPETSFADNSNNKNSNANRHESQTYLSYGAGATSNASSSKLAASAPQLPNLARSDSPLSFPSSQGPSTNQVPLIQISDTQNGTMSSFLDTTPAEKRMSTSSLPTSLQPGGQSPDATREEGNRSGDKGRRTSSLVASRDADLFLALGEVLDRTH
ncbi:BQ2448_1948 [Microbotryum intermedium]|uniref:BQ2448_1948 protein n=1 Tax=Microbotryum intermedium TaxID=269621 RepID=A0A238FCR1_9BASI|nr:BQ2448_1948 [Microbotryum intermedium]